MMITQSIVFVRGRRPENRRQVNSINNKRFNIIQLIDHTLQIASVAPALEIVPDIFAVLFFIGLQFIPITCPWMNLKGGGIVKRISAVLIACLRIVRGIAIKKTFRKDLVPYHSFTPFRSKIFLSRAG